MTLTKRQKQSIATKQKILDKAEELIGQRGFDSVTIDDIVEACGVAKGTFYLYFKSKDELVVYIEKEPYKNLIKELEQLSDRPLEEKLRMLIMKWFELINKFNIHFARQRLRHFIDPVFQELYGDSNTQMDIGLDLVVKFIKSGVESGELMPDTPVDDISHLITFSMQGCAIYHFKVEGCFPVMEWAESFTDMVFNSILKPYWVNKD